MLFGRKKKAKETATPPQMSSKEKEELLAKMPDLMPGQGKMDDLNAKTRAAAAKVKDLELPGKNATVGGNSKPAGDRKMADNPTNENGAQKTKEQPEGTIFTEPTPGLKEGGKTVAEMLGEVTWLMTQSQAHKNFFLSDLEWMAMTPILLKQFRVFYAKDRPIGVIFWGRVNDEVEERLKKGNARLKPQDWKSGDKLWVIDIVAPYGGQDEMLKDLKEKVFSEEEFRFLSVVDGKISVQGM